MNQRTECFAACLRRARTERGITQKELGEQLGFSEKTVSKWECGAAIPDIETLFSICEVLHVDLEMLFSTGETYYLGIDGGGTKTALLLESGDGGERRTLTVEGCNPVDVGIERAREILRGAIYEICRGIRLSSVRAFAGIAGGSTGTMKEELHTFFSELRFAAFENDSDNKNIIAAGLGDRDGVTVVMGTGFCVYTQKKGKHHRSAGWGYLLDDGGSGYNLGRDALHAYFAAYDGTGERTLLSEEIDRICPGGESALIRFVYGSPKQAVATFAPAVLAAMRRGDRVAKEILDRNMRVAAEVIEAAARIFSAERIPVVLAGGLSGVDEVVTSLRASLKAPEKFDLRVLDCSPVEGALMLAKRLGGRENE